MAYAATDEEGNETIFNNKPIRSQYRQKIGIWKEEGSSVWLPKGSIKKLIGKKLTWEDEPVELKE